MKLRSVQLFTFGLFLALFGFLTSCKKNKQPATPVNNELYQTPLTYSVEVLPEFTLLDSTRSNRTFKILARKPLGLTGPFPVVIFSHGGDANNNGHNSYDEWGNQLAKAGYFVFHIAHAENQAGLAYCDVLGIKADEREPTDFTKEPADGGTLPPIWYDRPRDVVALLNALTKIETTSGLKFDRTRIAMAGHSAGSYTVVTSAGAKIDFSPTVKDVIVSEPRIKAFLAISPQGIGRFGLDQNSWKDIVKPLMTATGTNDIGHSVTDPTQRLDPFKYATGPNKFELFVNDTGATHEMFGLNVLAGINTLTSLESVVLSSGLAFLDAYVRDYQKAKDWLASDAVKAASKNAAKISRK